MKHYIAVFLAILGANAACLAQDKASDKPRGTIAFASQTPRGFEVYACKSGSGKPTKLTDHPALDFNVAASRTANGSPLSPNATATWRSTP